MQRSAVSVWNECWKAHDKLKQLLLFSNGRSAQPAAVKAREEKEGNSHPPRKNHYMRPVQWIGFLLGPVLFFAILLFFSPAGLNPEAKAVLAITVWIAVWWITEAIPIPVTSLLPLILMPLTGALDGDAAAAAYGDPIIFLFLGGFMIAIAMEKWNLHQRIAMNIVSFLGTGSKRIVLGFMVATGFLSMWVSNTAAVMMMVPIGTAITYQAAQIVKQTGDRTIDIRGFEKAVIFGIGFAGTIGGLGTLIGTPPNIILAAAIKNLYGVTISFADWLFLAAPVVLILLILSWLYLVNIAFPIKFKELPGGAELIREEKQKLGKMSSEEKWVMAVFLFAAFMWITRTFIWQEFIPGISDAMIAILAGVLLFILPSRQKGGALLDWSVARDLPWGVLLLFGGGLAIASGFSETGLAKWIGEQLMVLEGLSMLLVVVFVTAFVLFLTEITSNTATATMIMPVLASLALALNLHPFVLMMPAAMAANCAFMLPVGTPPNAIIFATGKIKINEMVRAGFWINIIAIVFITIAMYVMMPMIFNVDITSFPENFK
ncbi:SLC13 family permease [Pseudobacillus badius]|uniref:SLC13 family permease n=1 Tax=Bacillus badius TaxID=1455 RepID=UPI0007B057A8|nr:DASS family sodium-coupled anion symporter [Bacillus badius]KZO00246.1 anion transporter [Bacillus badius]OCS86410.1 anion transporter [Bacillus badius]OVE52126.1 anion transporter [Bacillus badius]TDW03832.1 sodium-dependent dicarboxylate transporter 2/3/5 [Bacillus badius]